MDSDNKDNTKINLLQDNFLEQLNAINVSVSEEMLASFNTYYEMLVEWNKVMNLTAITEKSEVYVKHFLDSLAVAAVFQDKEFKSKYNLNFNAETEMKKLRSGFLKGQPLRVLDIGTGAGFPGIPLKIAYPNMEVTLLDSLNKRIRFLNEVIQKLNLNGITALHGRAEDFAHKEEYREKYDLCVSRAVANLAVLSEYCIPYVAPGGYFVAYKSGDIFVEIEMSVGAIKTLGGNIAGVKKMQLPGTDIERSFVIIKKCANTSKKYPRKAGLPSSKPLGL